jgi:hypothetical protein
MRSHAGGAVLVLLGLVGCGGVLERADGAAADRDATVDAVGDGRLHADYLFEDGVRKSTSACTITMQAWSAIGQPS